MGKKISRRRVCFFTCHLCDKIHYHRDIEAMPRDLYHPVHYGYCPHCGRSSTHRASTHRTAALARFMSEVLYVDEYGNVESKAGGAHVFDIGAPHWNKNLKSEKMKAIERWRKNRFIKREEEDYYGYTPKPDNGKWRYEDPEEVEEDE